MSVIKNFKLNDQNWIELDVGPGKFSIYSDNGSIFLISQDGVKADRSVSKYFANSSSQETIFIKNASEGEISVVYSTLGSEDSDFLSPDSQSGQKKASLYTSLEVKDDKWYSTEVGPGKFAITISEGSVVKISTDPNGDTYEEISKCYFGNLSTRETIYLRGMSATPAVVSIDFLGGDSANSMSSDNFVAGGGGTSSYAFLSPLEENGGNVSLVFDQASGLSSSVKRGLYLDLSNNSDFQFVMGEIGDINTDINALDRMTTDLQTKVGSVSLQTTAQDLSGAVNELKSSILNSNLNFTGALIKQGDTVSIGLENDIVLNPTGDKLTLNLNSNTAFRNVLLGIDEAKRIATFTDVGRVKPLQNHFTMNGMNGELGLDLTQTGVLATTFVTKTSLQTLQNSVNSNTQNIARIDTELADVDNAINSLEASKADSADVYAKTDTYSKTEVDGLLGNKADTSALSTIENQVQTNTNSITQNQSDIQGVKQSVQTLDTNSVKLTTDQSIDGLKTFLKELSANNIKVSENGTGYGAVNINNQEGYFSITEDGGSLVNLLATIGFVDSNSTFRIRNLAGGMITFNALAQYEGPQTPVSDNDLVPLSFVNQVKQDLLTLINSTQSGAIFFVGVISHTEAEVTLDNQLLTDFVQTTESRLPKNGDFVKTSDSFGFIYNGVNWVNFGQVSISIASTTTAGIVMLGSDVGELEDRGSGKVKVIGWDDIETRLSNLEGRVTSNTQSIQTANQSIATNTQNIQTNTQSINSLDTSVVKLDGTQTITGTKTFSNYVNHTAKLDFNTGTTPNDFIMRFVGDSWGNSQSTDLIRYHKGGPKSGYKIYLSNGTFNYAELWGLTLVSDMKDPTSDAHGANVRYVKSYAIPKVTTTATNTIQVTNSAQKLFNLDYVVEGTGYRNWSGIQIRAKQGTGSFENMWTVMYRDNDSDGIYMGCIGDKLTFERATKISNVNCEESDSDNTVVNKSYLNTKLTNLNQSFVDLTTQQIIGGEKDFTSELRALTLVANDNGSDYGAVDIRNQNGYFSISDDSQGSASVTLKAAMGFVDDASTFRIRNIAGGYVTFNHLVQYEGTYTPTDDKDLVPLASLNQVKQELLNKINSIPAGLHFVGEISHTSTEVTQNPDLLNQFVQTTESRQPRDGDFVRTSDSYGFIYSTTSWRNFGKISISIATTSNAGIIMLGSNPGELQDIGSGKVKVIGWDTVQTALTNLDNRTNTNTTNISLKANSADVYLKTETYTQTEVDNLLLNKADTSAVTSLESQVQANNQALQTKAEESDLTITNQNVTNLETNIGTIGDLPYSQTNVVSAINSVKDNSVLLDGDQTINGNKSFIGVTSFGDKVRMGNGVSNVKITPEDNSRKTITFGDSTIGADNRFDIDCENNSKIKNLPEPQTNGEPVRLEDLNNRLLVFQSTDTINTSNLPVGAFGFKLSSIS